MKIKNSIFELFNMLDGKEYDKDYILKHLNIKMPTFYKNIQKLRACGFLINKNNAKYTILRYKNILKLDNKEKSTIAYMLNLALKYLPKYKYDNFKNFIRKYISLANETDKNEIINKFQLIKKYDLIEEYEEKIDTLEEFILKKEKIKITLRSNRTFLIKPLKFDWKKDKPILHYINFTKNKEEKLNIENIAKIGQNNIKDYIVQDEEIIFELFGKLAKRYLLKNDERIVKSTKDTLIVASGTQDKETLFKRLLRYDTLCKILFPKKEVDNFNKLIDKAIVNIDLIK